MARVQQVIDDMSGKTLNEEVEATVIQVDGIKYEVDLGEASKAHLLAWLSGDGSYALKTGTSGSGSSSSTSSTGSGAKTKTHGYSYKEVKQWAIANGIKAANGNPITEKTPRIGQSVYDAYKEHVEQDK